MESCVDGNFMGFMGYRNNIIFNNEVNDNVEIFIVCHVLSPFWTNY